MESSYLDNMTEEPSMESSYLDNIIKEEKLSVCPNLFKGPTKITPKAWKTLVDWMLEVCTHSRREPDVFCLAILYLNSYMCNMDIKNERLKLIATVCLNLASKFTEKVQIKLCCLSIYDHCEYTVDDMKMCELHVLREVAFIMWSALILIEGGEEFFTMVRVAAKHFLYIVQELIELISKI